MFLLISLQKELARMKSELKKANVSLESMEYQESIGIFLKMFNLRLDPWPESWNKAFASAAKCPASRFM